MDETESVDSADAQPSTVATATVPLSNADVDNILSSSGRNRQRIRKACYPCNKRKIKCDRDERVPCGNCAKRPHPELCTFDDHAPRSVPPRSRTSNGHSRSSPHSAIPRPGQYPNTPDQPLLHGIQNASIGYDREYQSNGQSNGYGTWPDSRLGEEGVKPTTEPRASLGSEYGYGRSSGFQSVNAPASNGPQRVALSQSNRPAWDFAPPKSEPSTFWDRIGPLLPPQKHLLR
jgi:Fungal Zn(2)-Cys(6) binuclear cluster domain